MKVDTSKRISDRRRPVGHDKPAGSSGYGIAKAESAGSCSKEGDGGEVSSRSTLPGIPASKRRCNTARQNDSTKARITNTKEKLNRSPKGRECSSVHTLSKADDKKIKQHPGSPSEDDDSEAAENGGVASSGTDTGGNEADSSNKAKRRTNARSSASGGSVSSYATPPESPSEHRPGSRWGPPCVITDSSDTSSEESVLTLSERIKRCCETLALLISLICSLVVDCVGYCLCCCKRDDDDDLKYEYLQSTRRRDGVFFEKPEQVPPHKPAKVSPFNENVEDVKKRVQGNEQESPAKEEEGGIASTSNHAADMSKEWDRKRQRYKEIIIGDYCRAFKSYAEKGLIRGLGANRTEVSTIIENIKPVMYEYVDSESLRIINVRTDSGEDVSDEGARNVRNEVYSDLLYESLKKLNMSQKRIRETCDLFHETRKNYSRLEDKDGGDCCLVVCAYVTEFRSDLPYGASAYRSAIRKIKSETGI